MTLTERRRIGSGKAECLQAIGSDARSPRSALRPERLFGEELRGRIALEVFELRFLAR
jgi:hypothetical protein